MNSVLNLVFLVLFDVVILVALAVRSRRAQEWITAQAMLLTILYVALLYTRLPS